MPFIDGPARAVSYFAATSRSSSLTRKLRALALSDGYPPGGSTLLTELRLCQLVHAESKPISPKSAQPSERDDDMALSLGYDSSQLSPFSDVGIEVEPLLLGEWEEGVGAQLSYDSMPQTAMDVITAGWAYHSIKCDPSLAYSQVEDVATQMDVLGMTQGHGGCEVPRYFGEYHDRLRLREDYSSTHGNTHLADLTLSSNA